MTVEKPNPIRELLDDYVRDRLPAADRNHVEQAAREDEDIASEIAILRALQKDLKHHANMQAPSELGWARLSRAIETEIQPSRERDSLRRPTNIIQPAIWRYAAIILGIVAIGQSVLLIQQPVHDTDQLRYVTVSESLSEKTDLKIRFKPNISEEVMRTFLQENALEIVAGPSALGLYDLNILDEQLNAQTLLEKIETQTNIIHSVATP